MVYRIVADAVVVAHFAFILFVAGGALLAWRWPALVWAHVPALAWAAATVTIGFPCPLTGLEKWLRRVAGERGYAGGFVDHYIEDVVYPDEYTFALRLVAAVAIAVGYAVLIRRVRTRTQAGRPILAAGRRSPAPRRGTRTNSGSIFQPSGASSVRSSP